MAWICLIGSGILEIVWAYFLKLSEGFTVLLPSVLAVIFLMPSFFFLERAIRNFGIGMSYAVFTGIGIAGTTIIGVVALHESVSFWTVLFLTVLLTGIIGLRSCDGKEEAER
ncbi:MAG: DMT family transporter [Bacillota bacterium]